jgi:predicted Holliday junction resolvase-like endonuclease
MWDGIREWGLAALAILGAIFTPVAYVLGIRADIRVLEAKVESELRSMKEKLESEAASRIQRQEAIESWMNRVEHKLDKVLFGGRD